ncbi:cytochrome c oxidase subunit 6B1-like [Dysidea avara]|uniref:cytochrome c oxidase subunit 6B1-like n=1 Tax=Dysidea avara TaxID=196820 RepID=UPI00332E3180
MAEATATSNKELPWTPKYDARFAHTNQTKRCWQNFIDYQKCRKKRSEDDEVCLYYKRVYTSLCPASWVSDWNDQVEAGSFAGKI